VSQTHEKAGFFLCIFGVTEGVIKGWKDCLTLGLDFARMCELVKTYSINKSKSRVNFRMSGWNTLAAPWKLNIVFTKYLVKNLAKFILLN